MHVIQVIVPKEPYAFALILKAAAFLANVGQNVVFYPLEYCTR